MGRAFAAAALASTLLLGPALRAQAPGDTGESVDHVVAVVGNVPILNSQVEERIFSNQQAGQPVPTDPDSLRKLRRQVLSDLVDEELLVQQAERDTTIHVTDQDVSDAVDQRIRQIRTSFATELDYKNELKKAGFISPEEYRRWLTDQQRRTLLQNHLVSSLFDDQKLKPVTPTERELRDYFNATPDKGTRKAAVAFKQVVVAPRASPAARAVAHATADSIAKALRAGADFATAARRFSQDPGTKDQGGELGWFRRGQMVRQFDDAAFRLKPGVISDPVESPFGFHVIQVERVQPTEVEARHILITPAVTAAEADSARQLAERLRGQVMAGASFDSLQRIYSDSSEERSFDLVPLDQLPPAYHPVMQADSGQVTDIFELPNPVDSLRAKWAFALVTGKRGEGPMTFDEVKDQLRPQLAKQLAVQRYIARLRRDNYVEVRGP
ncbi:MAG TPA: peptidylprolyl isomerase [Gemmatimonadales bacterium]|nr:peptidylprolyl isomerase [Gemmatimonadales bacterium]